MYKCVALNESVKMPNALNQWFSTGLASPLNDKPRPKSRNIFNFSNVFNEKMVQFEPEIVQNITVCQHKKTSLMINQNDQQVAMLDGNIPSISCILIKNQKVHLKDTR